MRLYIHHYHHSDQETARKLDLILAELQRGRQQELVMTKEVDDLSAAVARNTSVTQSALALIQGFSARLADAGTDPAKLTALKAELDARDDELAAAVAANTPAA